MAVEIRWTNPDGDHDARVDVVRRAWLGAYSHIFSTAEIEGVFNGSLAMTGDWLQRRTAPAGTLVATHDDVVIGLLSLGILEADTGEVAALYVVPEHQGSGVGRMLWDAGLAVFAHRGLERLELWALTDGGARGFYEHVGCTELGKATVIVGAHRVAAVRYGRAVASDQPAG